MENVWSVKVEEEEGTRVEKEAMEDISTVKKKIALDTMLGKSKREKRRETEIQRDKL